MDRLPQELLTHIASFVERGDDQSGVGFLQRKKTVSKLPLYATISSKWQLAIESRTFRSLRLTSPELPYLAQVLTGYRRGFLSNLAYDIVLPTYTDNRCAKFEAREDMERNNQSFTYAVYALFQFLNTWEKESHSLSLDLSDIYSPMDRFHRGLDKYEEDKEQYECDLATALPILSGPSLRDFTLSFYHEDPSNEYFSPTSALLPSEPPTDHLSHALYTLSQSDSLTCLTLNPIVIPPDFYWPANPSKPPAWPNLRHYHIEFDMTTPGGDWYFIRDPSKPIGDDEGANDSDEPDPAEEESDTDSDTAASSDAWRPDTFNERHEARAVGDYPIRNFRTLPSDTYINPLVLTMARAAAHMPQLQSMSLTSSMRDPDGAGFEVYFHAATHVSKLDSEPGDADEARLYWVVGSWRPAEAVLKVWREGKEGLQISPSVVSIAVMSSMIRDAPNGSQKLLMLATCLFMVASASHTFPNGYETSPKTRSWVPRAIENETLYTPPSNLSALKPPREFTYNLAGGSVPLNNRGCFQLTIHALATLVKAQYVSREPTSTYLRVPSAPGMALSLSGVHQGGGFDVRFMIWGLTLAIKRMVDQERFRNWRFTLRWRGDLVGTLWYFYESSHDGVEGNGPPIWENTTRIELPTVPSRLVDENAGGITFGIEEVHDSNLRLNDVMMVIVSGLTDIAVHDMENQVRQDRFETFFVRYNARFRLWPDVQPPASPTWFTYEVVRSALQTVASGYLQQETIRSIRILIFRSGIVYGHGELTSRSASLLQGGLVAQAQSNVTSG
ncbi:MAG: hypothetical protein Q9179_001482 [Wetmoreana sp. 5 TL-2023]